MEVQPREIQRYVTPDGRIPFDEEGKLNNLNKALGGETGFLNFPR